MGLRHCNDCKVLIEYSNDMDDTYENIDEYNPNKKLKAVIACVYMITDMLNNKKLVTESNSNRII